MASYYYLISSLPDLRADAEMPISYEEFLDACKDHVSPANFQLLRELSLSSTTGPLIEEWAGFYGALTREINYQRCQRLGKSYSNELEPDASLTQIANGALGAKTPLEAEKLLLALEFEKLDNLVGLHVFDDYVLFGYAIKLKLLERQNCFEKEKGRAEFKALFDEVQKRVYSL